MSDERFTVVQGEVTRPLFTPEDVENLVGIEQTLISEFPEDRDILRDIAIRIQQWLDQQASRGKIREKMRDAEDRHASAFGAFLIDETDVSEG